MQIGPGAPEGVPEYRSQFCCHLGRSAPHIGHSISALEPMEADILCRSLRCNRERCFQIFSRAHNVGRRLKSLNPGFETQVGA